MTILFVSFVLVKSISLLYCYILLFSVIRLCYHQGGQTYLGFKAIPVIDSTQESKRCNYLAYIVHAKLLQKVNYYYYYYYSALQ